ncbi:MAG TPA: 3-deoxy-7-phosphoheptulonate synthase, partial [Planctomycetaceae bacterium]
MIVVMKKGAAPEAVKAMAARVEEMGMKAHVIVGTERTVVAAVGAENEADRQTLASYEEVEQVVAILAP